MASGAHAVRAGSNASPDWSTPSTAGAIRRRLHARQGKALTDFTRTLPPGDSDMAGQLFKDPYLFDMLGTADPRRETEVEAALVAHAEGWQWGLG